MASGIDYHERRVGEYDATSWKRFDADGRSRVVMERSDSLGADGTVDLDAGGRRARLVPGALPAAL